MWSNNNIAQATGSWQGRTGLRSTVVQRDLRSVLHGVMIGVWGVAGFGPLGGFGVGICGVGVLCMGGLGLRIDGGVENGEWKDGCLVIEVGSIGSDVVTRLGECGRDGGGG